MDPADQDQEPRPAQVRATVTQQGILLGQHEANIRALVEANQTLTNQVSSLTSQLTSLLASQTSASPPEPGAEPPRDIHSATPEPFSGQPHLCRGFLFHCSLQFQLRPVSFTTDIAKIHYILGLLRGKALTWAEARFAQGTLAGCVILDGASELVSAYIVVSHFLPACPWRPKDQLQHLPLQALIDSGAEENFLDLQVATQAGVPFELLEKPRDALAVDGRIMAQRNSSHSTPHPRSYPTITHDPSPQTLSPVCPGAAACVSSAPTALPVRRASAAPHQGLVGRQTGLTGPLTDEEEMVAL
ncbi:hypothetical protein L3Q82_006858 [Scortum barcoo]|uniref:Uncharacterized protein n=1 Tax=Scortum barcoo TaxID=214431 RepID=A0ACB8WVX1_9TELE|nr:hypothetical protein L3Q82_006858 [Scortum barcoo]